MTATRSPEAFILSSDLFIEGQGASDIPLPTGGYVLPGAVHGALPIISYGPYQNLLRGAMSVASFVMPLAAPSLSIGVDVDDNHVVASDTATGIFGVGETLSEAFADLGDALIEHRDVLERAERVSPGLAEQLEYLRQRIPRLNGRPQP